MPEFDTVIRGGTVVDGTRRPALVADVGIREGRIAAVGKIPVHAAARHIDAHGLVVAPGAIDLHTHYDAQVHWDPYCSIASWHGVTSVTVGNCGFGLAPVRPADVDRAMLTLSRNEAIPLRAMQAALPFTWETFAEWMDHLERLPLGINLSHLAPVSPIVAYACGGFDAAKDRPLSEGERRRVVQLLGEALDAGAIGWGAQRQLPGHFAAFQRDHDGSPMVSDLLSDSVYLDLAAALRGRDGTFIQFAQIGLKGIQADLAFNERLAEASGRPLLYNAVAPLGTTDRSLEPLRWIAAAQARGNQMFAQGATVRSPFVFTFEDWNLYDSSEQWRDATLGSVEERMAKLADPEVRQALRAEYDASPLFHGFFGPQRDYRLHRVEHADLKRFEGRTLGEIADSLEAHVVDAMLDISLADGLRAEWMTPVLVTDPDQCKRLFDSPHVIPGASDGGAHVKFLASGIYPTDLIAWLVRDTGRLSLEEAHYRLSTLPATIAGFRDRGTLEPGKAADLVVYDLKRLAALPIERAYDLPAGEWRRVCRAEGYHQVIVNGEPIFTDGQCTGATPGRLLRGGRGGR
jgi:N-acyl-D-amino-acid deacylase